MEWKTHILTVFSLFFYHFTGREEMAFHNEYSEKIEIFLDSLTKYIKNDIFNVNVFLKYNLLHRLLDHLSIHTIRFVLHQGINYTIKKQHVH